MADRPDIVSCQTCQGTGRIPTQRGPGRCQTCQGAGVAVWWAGQWWSWRQALSSLTILERRWEYLTRLVINGVLFVFFLAGLVLGGRVLLEAFNTGQLLNALLTQSGEWQLTAWWFGLLCGLYLFYRLERELSAYPKIPSATATSPTEIFHGAVRPEPANLAILFNETAQRQLEQAWQIARYHRHAELTPLHILHVISATPAVGSMLVRAGVAPAAVLERVDRLLQSLPTAIVDPVISPATHEILVRAFQQAAINGRLRVTPPYLLAAIAQIDDPAREVLYELGIEADALQHIVAWLTLQDELRRRMHEYRLRAAAKPRGVIDRGYTASATPQLNRYSTDLTRLARDGRLPFVVGREEELKKTFRVMESSRRSVILVGDQGVGKTNVLYALAERMVTEEVPEPIEDKRLVLLSAGALVAGATSTIEERVQTIVEEISRAGNIVLAVENFDQLVGVSSTGGGLDAASMIANAVSQRQFYCLATANAAEFRRILEHGGVMTAFEKVEIPEMNDEQAIVALESRLTPLENKHQVFFSYAAVAKSVQLSERYLHEKTLPGKALEILEEAAVLARRSRGKNTLVVGQDVAAIVSEQSHVDVGEITTDEQTKLLNLEAKLHERVVGQDEAVKAVANAMRRARAELRDTKRPIANLLFLGPTGVGKTELAKTLATVYFGSEEAMIRLDMSEYQEVSSINRLVGAPPGYAGAGTGGFLTEAVRARPFSLVLLDELEKAHPDILNLFLQVMDDGRLTDSTGRTIDFTNTIIIATSNAATQYVQDRLKEGATLETVKTELMGRELSQYFRPEFLNRFDSIVLFSPLGPVEVRQIVGLMINQIAKQMQAKGITLKASPEAMTELAQQGFDPSFGARPLRRVVQEKVDNALAKFMLQGKLSRRDVAVLEAGGVIRVEKAEKL